MGSLMGLYYNFYVQKKAEGRWVVPAGFSDSKGERDESGYVTWIDDEDSVRQVFWGAKALFPMRRECPPDITDTLLFQRCGASGFSVWYHSWLSLDELLLDLWDETDLIVCKRIAARHARLFGDGRQPFPRQGLLSAGIPPAEVEDLENTSYCVSDAFVVDEPIDWNYGKKLHQLKEVAPEYLAEVTWQVSISNFLGQWRTAEFQNLRRFGRDEELRIICLFS
jgi:hypothetical protein